MVTHIGYDRTQTHKPLSVAITKRIIISASSDFTNFRASSVLSTNTYNYIAYRTGTHTQKHAFFHPTRHLASASEGIGNAPRGAIATAVALGARNGMPIPCVPFGPTFFGEFFFFPDREPPRRS